MTPIERILSKGRPLNDGPKEIITLKKMSIFIYLLHCATYTVLPGAYKSPLFIVKSSASEGLAPGPTGGLPSGFALLKKFSSYAIASRR